MFDKELKEINHYNTIITKVNNYESDVVKQIIDI
jgi:hypothetical protein